MKRRLIVIAAALVALTGAGATSASAAGLFDAGTTSSRYWGCIVADDVDLGYCLKNPLPERLPLPGVPTAPTAPAPTV